MKGKGRERVSGREERSAIETETEKDAMRDEPYVIQYDDDQYTQKGIFVQQGYSVVRL